MAHSYNKFIVKINTGRFLHLLTSSQLCSTETGFEAHTNFANESVCLITFGSKGHY
jgi:hypothetical protein